MKKPKEEGTRPLNLSWLFLVTIVITALTVYSVVSIDRAMKSGKMICNSAVKIERINCNIKYNSFKQIWYQRYYLINMTSPSKKWKKLLSIRANSLKDNCLKRVDWDIEDNNIPECNIFGINLNKR